jgi:outer membrane protein, multidrug efflux system
MKRFFRYSYLFILMIGICIVSCKTGKQYQRPQLALPANFSDSTRFGDTTSISDIPWRIFFSDSVLRDLIDSGLARNYDIQYALRNISISQSYVKQANWLWVPQVNGGIQSSVNHSSTNTGGGTTSLDYQLGLNMSWEIDIWGKFSLQRQASIATYLQNVELVKALKTSLVSNISQGYFSLLMLDQQLAETKKTLEVTMDVVKLTRLLFDAGNVTYLGVQQAEAQEEAAAQLVPTIEQAIGLQENALQVLTGNLPGVIHRTVSITDMYLTDSTEAGLPAALVSLRPDVRAAEMSLVNANAQVGINQANMYPALNITAGTGLESIKTSNWFNIPGSLFGLAGATLLQPILQGRQLKTQFEIAKFQREQAVIQFRSSVLNAVTEVSNALIQIKKLKEQEHFAKKRSDTLAAAIINSQLLFKNDLANYLEVITAQQNALDAELSLAFVQRAILNAKVDLYRSLGGGWR